MRSSHLRHVDAFCISSNMFDLHSLHLHNNSFKYWMFSNNRQFALFSTQLFERWDIILKYTYLEANVSEGTSLIQRCYFDYSSDANIHSACLGTTRNSVIFCCRWTEQKMTTCFLTFDKNSISDTTKCCSIIKPTSLSLVHSEAEYPRLYRRIDEPSAV